MLSNREIFLRMDGRAGRYNIAYNHIDSSSIVILSCLRQYVPEGSIILNSLHMTIFLFIVQKKKGARTKTCKLNQACMMCNSKHMHTKEQLRSHLGRGPSEVCMFLFPSFVIIYCLFEVWHPARQ